MLTTAFFKNAVATIQADTTDDFAFLCAIAANGGGDVIGFYPIRIANTKNQELHIMSNQLTFACNDGVNSAQTAGLVLPAAPYVIGGVLERATGMMRTGYCALGGTAVVSAEVDASLVGSLLQIADTQMGFGDFGPGAGSLVSDWMAAHGVGACTDVSANFAAVLQSYADYITASGVGGALVSAMD